MGRTSDSVPRDRRESGFNRDREVYQSLVLSPLRPYKTLGLINAVVVANINQNNILTSNLKFQNDSILHID